LRLLETLLDILNSKLNRKNIEVHLKGLFGKWRNQVDGTGLKGILRNFDL
jgi:hypothetical protein